MNKAKEILKKCTQEWPLAQRNQHHCLVVDQDYLVLYLIIGNEYRSFILDDNDINYKSVDTIIQDIKILNTDLEKPV